MEFAMYFLGVALFAFAGAIVWAVRKALGALSEIRSLVDKVPAVAEKAEATMESIKTIVRDFSGQIEGVKSTISDISLPTTETFRKTGSDVGAAGIEALKSFAFGLTGKAPVVDVTPDKEGV